MAKGGVLLDAKYQEIVRWVKERIAAGELSEGDRLEPENEMAARFSVSRQTVRRALAELSSAGLVESRQGSGSFVAAVEGDPRGSSRIVGVVITYVDTYIFPKLIQGIESVLAEAGYAIQLAITHNRTEKERQALEGMLACQVAGIIAEPSQSGLPSPSRVVYERIEREGMPVVLFNGYFPDMELPHVVLNDRRAGYLGTRCLIEAGHREIAGIFKLDDCQGRLRYQGYLDAMLEAGLPVKDELIHWYSTREWEHGMDFEGELGNCTGVLCYNDEVAIRLMEMLRKQGTEVPEEISLVGIDDSPQAEFCRVPLTTVKNPVESLGRQTALELLRLLEGEKVEQAYEFEPRLVIRRSVDMPPR